MTPLWWSPWNTKHRFIRVRWWDGMRKGNEFEQFHVHILEKCFKSMPLFIKKNYSTNLFDQRIIYFLLFFFSPFTRFHEFINKKWDTINFEFIIVKLFFQDVVLMHVICYAKWHENARCYKFGNYLFTCMWVYVWYVLCKVAWKNNGMNIMHYTLWHESKVDPCYVSSECKDVIYLKIMCIVSCMNEDKMWM